MRLRALCLAVSLFALTVAGAGRAVTPAWNIPDDRVFVHLTAPGALGATAMVNDAQGYLWIGTQNGLARWDGYRLHTYTPDPGTPGALPDNYISSLHVDGRGRLWVGTNAGGLARYEADKDSFTAVPVEMDGQREVAITALVGDGGGAMWIGTMRGLAHMNTDTGQGQAVQDGALSDTSGRGRIYKLLLDRQSTLWVGTRYGLLRRAHDESRFVPVPLPIRAHPMPMISALFEDGDGRVWIGTAQHGVFVVPPGARQPQQVEDLGSSEEVGADIINAIIEARPGEIWVAVRGHGIYTYEAASHRWRHEHHDGARTNSLASDAVWSMYRDASGLVWVGSVSALSRYDTGEQTAGAFFGDDHGTHLAIAPSVTSVLAFDDGKLWLGLGEGGIECMDPAAGTVGLMGEQARRAYGALVHQSVAAMARAADASVYIGTSTGLYRASADGQRVTAVELARLGPATVVTALYLDADRLWVGGNDGLWELDLAKGEPEVLRHLDNELGDPRVTAIRSGKHGALWVGTYSSLIHLDRSTGAVTRLPADPHDRTALPGGLITTLLMDRAGRLWVGTSGRGILVEEGRGPKGGPRFHRLNMRDGLPQNAIDMLLLDHDGYVWASTDDGLARIDPGDLSIRAYRTEQGVGILSHWAGSGAVAASGELVFGGSGGLTVVHPNRLSQPSERPRLTITEARVGGVPLAPSSWAAGKVLQVGAAERSLMVEFSALEFKDPDHLRYDYRLEGFDTDWIATPATHRLAAYTNLPPGDYKLQLRVAGPDGLWAKPLEQAVHVGQSWYQRAELKIVALGGVFLLLAGLVHLRTLYLRRRQRELQRLVAERTAELEQRGMELRRSQEQLQQMAYFDTLTGLPNRRMFNDELRRLIARSQRAQGDFALLLVDLDGFKQINDADGHDAGDALLVGVANRLKALVRETDCVARLGGDEFAVLAPQADDGKGIAATCQRMLAELAKPLQLSHGLVGISASIGVALYPSEGKTADGLYKSADLALYRAKRGGRNTWRWSLAESAAG